MTGPTKIFLASSVISTSATVTVAAPTSTGASATTGTVSAGATPIAGDYFKPLRDANKANKVDLSRLTPAALRMVCTYLAVSAHVVDLISMGANDFVIMVIEKKRLEQFQVKETTTEESGVIMRMGGLQEAGNIDPWSGRPPRGGWPSDLLQFPADWIPNIRKVVQDINGIFQLLHSTHSALSRAAI